MSNAKFKISIAVLIIILIALIGIYLYYTNYGVDFGGSKVALPNGYELVNSSDDNTEIFISNGEHKIGLKTYEKENVTQLVNKYNESKNNSVEKTTLNINGITVLKTSLELNDSTMISYWFSKNGHQYRYYGKSFNGLEQTFQELMNTTEDNLLMY